MKVGFVKLMRSKQAEELMQKPNEFLLLTLIAMRAKRTNDFSVFGLVIGEALIGDYKMCGLTERKYRTAKKNLELWGQATFKPTNKGTIAKIISSDIYDINPEASDEQTVSKEDDQPTTNKKLINKETPPAKKKVSKKTKTFSSNSDEIRLSKLLFSFMRKNSPDIREPNFDTWALSVDRLIRINKKTPAEIEDMIEWCQNDDFWFKNILSTEKLRSQFDKLILQKNGRAKPQEKPHGKIFIKPDPNIIKEI